jgi:hypothetical protein
MSHQSNLEGQLEDAKKSIKDLKKSNKQLTDTNKTLEHQNAKKSNVKSYNNGVNDSKHVAINGSSGSSQSKIVSASKQHILPDLPFNTSQQQVSKKRKKESEEVIDVEGPENYIGKNIYKKFGKKVYVGKVSKYKHPFYEIYYEEDGDKEDMEENELVQLLLPPT